MPSGFVVGGRGDLDALFLARASTKRADVQYRVGGVDIANRYEPIGAGTPIAATGFKTGGTDLASLFRDSGQPLLSVTLSNGTYINSTTVASVSYNSDGTVTKNAGTSGPAYTWLLAGSAGACEIRCTQTSGSAIGGSTLGTWLALSSSRIFSMSTAAAAIRSGSGLIEIRRAADLVVLASCNISLISDRT